MPVEHPLIPRNQIEDLIFGPGAGRRHTQDSPVLPDVWIKFGEDPSARCDLLLSPERSISPARLARELLARLTEFSSRKTDPWEMSINETHVVVKLTLDELVLVVLPLTKWWATEIERRNAKKPKAKEPPLITRLKNWLAGKAPGDARTWLAQLLGWVLLERARKKPLRPGDPPPDYTPEQLVAAFETFMRRAMAYTGESLLWSVNLNRPAVVAISRSVKAIKADAATNVFGLDCSSLRWAIVDTGIDATHIAFRKYQGESSAKTSKGDKKTERKKYKVAFGPEEGKRGNHTRVIETYDFTNLRALVGSNPGASINWEQLRPKLRVLHTDPRFIPTNTHGTHVAGILAADWRPTDTPRPDVDDEGGLQGVCPDISLYDLRALRQDGSGDEFSVVAALQFIRWINANSDQPLIHGVNISISLLHDIANYACGRTPVCEECERLVAAGTVVVVAAGNEGYAQFSTPRGPRDGYRSISITDPGNAEGVITVGATHRYKPHTFGVSYFSSRGPTGDGRAKPDLVAPGEKIRSLVPDQGSTSMDGTSMAAPHVSGAAALLMARHGELIGQPARIKQILCKTATDLGRERFFQGAGMVDVLRALQAV